MPFRIGLETNFDGQCIAWVLGHPGCFADGPNQEAVLDILPAAIENYIEWIHQNSDDPWLALANIEYQIEETWDIYQINEAFELVEDGYSVNSWFLHDWKPLTAEDIEHGLQLLSWSRTALMTNIENLTAEQLQITFPGERWNILGILNHIGGAEWWYLNRLGLAFPQNKLPGDALERLAVVRTELLDCLPKWEGVNHVVGIDGEFWSPRKLLRRAIWHELDHVNHIRKLRHKLDR